MRYIYIVKHTCIYSQLPEMVVRNVHATTGHERRQHRERETEEDCERVRKSKPRDAALSSFKTMRRGRLVWSPDDCCYPVSLLHLNASPHTHRYTHTTHACENTHWQPSAYTIHCYHCCTWVTQMCFPRTYISQSRAQCGEQREKMRRGVDFTESEIGGDAQHKQRRQSKGWASETATMSQQCKGGRKQKRRAGLLRLTHERGHKRRGLIIHVRESP